MRRLAWFAALLALAACGPSVAPSPQTAAVAYVKNEGFSLMRVYLLVGSSAAAIRLGAVDAQQSEHFRFTVSPGQDYRFLYSPLASDGTYVTEQVLVQPGDTVELHIANYLPFSSVWLRR